MNWRKWFEKRGGDEERRYRAYKARLLEERLQEELHCRPSAPFPTPSTISSRDGTDGSAPLNHLKRSAA